ncbi:MAG: EamA family transporter [Armatimonadota bacterium]
MAEPHALSVTIPMETEGKSQHFAGSRLDRIPAAALLMLAIASLQIGGALAVNLFARLGPLGTVWLRVTIAAVILLAVWRPQFDRNLRVNFVPLALFGLSIAAMNVCIYQAFARIPFGIAVTLEFLGPLGLAVYLSRRVHDYLWAGLAFIGVALLTPLTGNAFPDPIGVVYALLAGVCWAAYAKLGAAVGRVFPGGTGLALGIAIAALLLLPIGIRSAGPALLEPPVLVTGLLIALASTVIPFSLEFEALRRLPARTYGILVSLDPAAATVTGAVLLHQPLTLRTIAAVICVVSAALGVTLASQRNPENQ